HGGGHEHRDGAGAGGGVGGESRVSDAAQQLSRSAQAQDPRGETGGGAAFGEHRHQVDGGQEQREGRRRDHDRQDQERRRPDDRAGAVMGGLVVGDGVAVGFPGHAEELRVGRNGDQRQQAAQYQIGGAPIG